MQFGMDMARNSRPAFGRDSHRERAVAKFLDYHLYPKHFQSTNRVNDKERQLAGIDLFATHKDIDGEMKIDEKAATSWSHREIHTFAFELSFILGGKEIGGWFLDKENSGQTTHWLCIWPRSENKGISSVSDILWAEALLIEVRKLRNWVRRMAGKADFTIEEAITNLRSDSTITEVMWGNLRVIISRGLPERPVNLLITKDVLRSIASESWRLPDDTA